MRKLLLTLFAAMTASTMFGQKVTLDFTNPVDDWGLPLKANAVKESAEFTNGTYTITVVGGTDTGVYAGGSEKNGYTYLMMGKQGAAIVLPAFDFAVGSIVVTGNTGASKATVMNIFVGETAVSTETTGSVDPNTYSIAQGYQAAGNVYALTITSKHNAQVTKIEIYESGDEPTPTPEPTSIANTPETAYSVTKAVELIAAGEDLGTQVYVAGTISAITEVSPSYGNATYDITDGTTTLTVFRGLFLGNEKFTSEDQIKEGDEVIVYGKLQLYGETNEMSQGNYIYSLNGQTKEPEVIDYSKVEAISIADFLQKADTAKQYQLTGVVRNVVNTTYGNFDLVDQKDENVKIYIYGVVKGDNLDNNKIWSSLGVAEGDVLTIVGTYTTYNDVPQIAKAIYVKHKKGSEPAVSIANTPETAYTVTEAIDITNAGKDLATSVYVKGKIASISEVSTQYGNATFDITDGTNTLTIFRTKYLDNEAFTAEDQVKVGDEVIVFGALKIYNDAPEMVNGQLCKLNDTVADGISGVKADKSGAIFDLSGRRVQKAQKGLYIVNGKKVIF